MDRLDKKIKVSPYPFIRLISFWGAGQAPRCDSLGFGFFVVNPDAVIQLS
jgi:hypothetical protein